MDIQLIAPVFTPGIGRQYVEALPEPTQEFCGEQGKLMAVGFSVHYIVYRATFDHKKGAGSWNFLYSVVS